MAANGYRANAVAARCHPHSPAEWRQPGGRSRPGPRRGRPRAAPRAPATPARVAGAVQARTFRLSVCERVRRGQVARPTVVLCSWGPARARSRCVSMAGPWMLPACASSTARPRASCRSTPTRTVFSRSPSRGLHQLPDPVDEVAVKEPRCSVSLQAPLLRRRAAPRPRSEGTGGDQVLPGALAVLRTT